MNSSRQSSHGIGKSAIPSAEDPFWSAPVALQSSVLAHAAYNYSSATLRLEFCSGAIYQFFHVPRQTYEDLLDAESKGVYYNREIRNAFPCAQL